MLRYGTKSKGEDNAKIYFESNSQPPFSPIDIVGPFKKIEITQRDNGAVIWVNVDEICVLRLTQVSTTEIEIWVRKGPHVKRYK